MSPFSIYLCTMNLLAFCLYGLDKGKAMRHAYRISEKTLFTMAILGGWMGAYVGMMTFHHKTKKALFRYGVPVVAILWIGGLYYCASNHLITL